ncbi:hypothetical protein N658DRAFT_522074 [Parathielavia hyrcaniae]|uniref:Uncharacterized protein n=1 Tax=Parathielavia hyrcaniae TaxID=113614 RepID=A0AAN6Q6C0_9PEZI|nr:hypothetical protein N658DRAFT_522074 [Parathielavia hyrcaniae]
MSGMMNKVKDAVQGAVHPDKKNYHNEPEGTHGPHSSRPANAADPRVDSDRDHSHTAGGTGTTGHTAGGMGTTGRAAGQGEYGSAGYGTHGTYAEGTHGPHSGRMANAADPRVDSDRDNSRTMGAGRTAGHGEYGSSGFGTGSSEGAHGPHGSRMANAADPRVDIDRENARTVGGNHVAGYGSGTHGAGYGSTQMPGTGTTGSHVMTGMTGTTGAGYGSSAAPSSGYSTGSTGMTGTQGASAGSYGPHGSRMANTADPPVDSDRSSHGAIGSGPGVGPGPAPKTAGPHKSDMANKMDPRVDSNLDGSKTMGGDKTYQYDDTFADRDPTDASQVPPSVMRDHLGDPSIEHGDITHHRERRHSTKTPQETFSGV